MKLEFEVRNALPPKKSGERSMWNEQKDDQFRRIVCLRTEALQARDAIGQTCAFGGNVKVTLEVHMVGAGRKRSGDLDNFITGICDGLMAADPKAFGSLHRGWQEPRNAAIGPEKAIAWSDDSQVASITATKHEDTDTWYRVVIEEM